MNWYRKPHSGRYLNYNSHHLISQKIGIVFTLVDYSIKLSHSQFDIEYLKLIKKMLLLNNYPNDFIDNCIFKSLNIINSIKNYQFEKTTHDFTIF